MTATVAHLTVAPTGRIVTDADPGTPPWFAARRGGITGTDLPKILGDSPYGNALSVWHDKRGDIVDELVSEAGEWGHILEDPIAQEWARRNKVQVVRVGVVANTSYDWQRASLDRLVHGCPDADLCGLEVKTRSAFKAGMFRDDIPDDVLAQVAWGRLVTGLPHMHVAVLIGGQRMLEFTYEPDTQLEGFLIENAAKLWQAVEDGNPPEVEPDSDGVLIGLLNSLYQFRTGTRELPPKDTHRLAVEYREAHEDEKEATSRKEKAKAGLIALLDDGEIGVVDEQVIFTYRRPAASESVSTKSLRDLKSEDPDLYEQLLAGDWVTISNPAPRFLLK
jgi:putative phage-type endonuclease